mmetsp:Transcript_19978/g.30022  ORF Transcript_19978/g.30022 Transcript_19978/m.30022 type:complete len:92 (-) Transcript_19978:888-1163(-)
MADEDDFVDIRIGDIEEESIAQEKAMAKAKASKPTHKQTAKKGIVLFGVKKRNNFKTDVNIFLRNPSNIPGGISKMPEYGNKSSNPKHAFA